MALALLSFGPTVLFGQSTEVFYEQDKMYVVVAVIALIFLGLGAYLFRLDRKIGKLENEK